MIFAALQSAALEGAEKIINAALVHDPASAERLRALQGKVLLVDSSMPPLRIAVEPSATGIMLHSNWQDSAEVTVSGTLVSLAAMAINADETVSFSGTGVNVSGNLEVLRQLNHIMAELDIDWEAALAELIGDVPAHLLGETIRNSAEFRSNALNRAQSALAEVSQEELRLTPSKNEYQSFVQSVRHLSTDVDRLAARANKLRLSLQQRKSRP
ncbi:SCP2 sterol-binding domain-containing protein [Porticoccaceae bacterium]|nr:SCP2 sterol-binding domain-containing protein [Porticoccaceae bacterium]